MKIRLIIISLLILIASCDKENRNNCLEPIDIANSSCPASDILLLCESFFCGAAFPPNENGPGVVVDFFFPPLETPCEFIDCNTLDCGFAGPFTNLEVNEFGTPSGSITNLLGQTTTFGSCTIIPN